ncbi:uncharacterized protein LOC110455900 [Mizuhopecten yessoensis]|uniref:Uncharacterized protein n=1 Tax=Mizuhopecten yessoensis TaxID=6573 RepID=A0A210QC58_MIZYE|nr:uncharacterized protein LOC110455900 [Mizuhopecten yessoensis]OWF46312.1 hypothetical protein KP79_PYT01437 [Mizuhopecten yessoensis]
MCCCPLIAIDCVQFVITMKKEGVIALLLFMIMAHDGTSLFLHRGDMKLHDEWAIRPTASTYQIGEIDIEAIINAELTGPINSGFTDVLGHLYGKRLEGLQRK